MKSGQFLFAVNGTSSLLLSGALTVLILGVFSPARLTAEEPAAPPGAERPAAAEQGSAAELARQQEEVAEKYKRFEQVLLRMAELTAPTDPKRAALLRKAVAESKQQLIGMQLDKLAELLAQDRLSVALNNQGDVNRDLAELLQLLLSEERDKSLKDERARLKDQIRRVGELINKERQIQGQTSGRGDVRELAPGQGKLADEAGKLAEDMKPAADGKDGKPQQDDADKPGGDKKPDGDDKDKADGKSGDGKQGEGDQGKQGKSSPPADDDAEKKGDKDKSPQNDDDKPAEKSDDKQSPDDKGDTPKPSEGQDSQPGKSQDGKQPPPQDQQGEQGQQGGGEQESSDAQQQQQQQPSESARKRVQAAQEKMEAARQKLEKAERQGAVEDQESAIRELEQAKAELEEILRQLREEELERMLAMLEARFRKMLQAQLEVYEGTKRVDAKPLTERSRDDEIEAGRLSRKESQIVMDAESALAVLREEGSAVAFPEAVEQMRDDMEQIVRRLAQADVGDITQSIEEDVIAALEEMIDSLQKAQQDLEKQKQQAQPSEGEAQDPPLIDTLAELKMIRSLQMRVNMRTKRLARLVEGELGQADKPELLEQLRRLAEREESVFRVTRDIVTGKNK